MLDVVINGDDDVGKNDSQQYLRFARILQKSEFCLIAVVLADQLGFYF